MHPRAVANALGAIVAAAGATMLVPALYALLAGDGHAADFALPAFVSLIVGAVAFVLTRNPNARIFGRDVFLIVVLGWISVAAVGSTPFLLSGLMGPADAFFESMGGYTTTGASTVETPEDVARSLLLWRSLTQWSGGIGIVLILVAVAPLVGFGAAQLYSAEVASPVAERLTPRIQDTAKILVYVYGALTVGGVVSLLLAGMGPFDAVNHALTTVSTGGYSTRSGSIGAFDSLAVELCVAGGMVLSGVNFALYYQAARGRRRRVSENRELRWYLAFILIGTAVVAATLYFFDYYDSPARALRESFFQTTSLLTGTAFTTAGWTAWGPLAQGLLMVFMAIGACSGSTSGGVKVVRAILLVRHAAQDVFRMVHPQAVTPLRLGDRVVSERVRTTFLGFFFVYVLLLTLGTLLMGLHQIPVGHAFGAVFACLNITGTALGPVGDPAFYAALPPSAKLLLTVYMLLGRLELFTVLVLLSPTFWRD